MTFVSQSRVSLRLARGERHTTRHFSSLPCWALVFALAAGPAHGDWLVTHDGHQIETRGTWKVEDRRVLFTSLGGTLQSIDLAEIDLHRSEQLSEARRHQPRQVYPAPVLRPVEQPPPRVEPQLRRDEVAAVAPTAPDVYVPARRPRATGDRIEASIRLGGTSHDNFFAAADDAARTGVTSGEAEALLSWRLAPESRHRAYVQLTHTELENLPGNDGLRVGMRLDNRRHALNLSNRVQRGRNLQNLDDDDPESVERRTFAAAYQMRPGPGWSIQLAGELDEDRSEDASGDAETMEMAAALRYRGFERWSPEIGVTWAERSAVDPSRELDGRGLFVRFRLYPARRVAFDLGARRSDRIYSIADRDASNFGRRDTRWDWSVRAHLLVLDDLVLTLRYEALENDSSRPGRGYSAQRFGLAAGFTLGGGQRTARDEPTTPTTQHPAVRAAAEPEEAPPPTAALVPETPAPAAPALESREEAQESDETSRDAAARPAERQPIPGAGAADATAPTTPVRRAEPPLPRSDEPAGETATGRPTALAGPAVFAGVHLTVSDERITTIEIRGRGLEVGSAFSLPEPNRYVLDFPGLEVARSSTVTVGSRLVQRVRIGQFEAPPPGIVRVVFDLERPVVPRVERFDGGLRVTFVAPG